MSVRLLLVCVRNYSHKAHRRYFLRENWKEAFGKYLLFTNTWTLGILMVVGDLVEQEIEYQRNVIRKPHDWGRSSRMFVAGLILGPVNHFFYGWLNKILPKRTTRAISQKILLDQIIMSPLSILLVFYSAGFLEGKTVNGSTNEFKGKFLSIYTVDWCFSPPTQFVNFYLVPVKFQVLYINTVTMVYNIYLSYMKHK